MSTLNNYVSTGKTADPGAAEENEGVCPVLRYVATLIVLLTCIAMAISLGIDYASGSDGLFIGGFPKCLLMLTYLAGVMLAIYDERGREPGAISVLVGGLLVIGSAGFCVAAVL